MPIYDYQCKHCNKGFEAFTPLKDWDITPPCPQCNNEVKKIITSHIQREEPIWLDKYVRRNIQDQDLPKSAENPELNTRTEYNKYLKQHGLVED